MEIQVFIFSYKHYCQAKSMYDQFETLGYDTYLLNCHSDDDPYFEPTSHIIKLPNVYYSGQWNEAITRLTGDVVLITNADVTIPNIPVLMRRLKQFYNRTDAGLYAPNVDWTPWTYNPYLLPDLGGGLKEVPSTDSVIWAVLSEIAQQIGSIDLAINHIGWGIEIVAAYYCYKQRKKIVRDYAIKCQHPESSAYDRWAANNQFRDWVEQLRLDSGFWNYYHRRNNYDFGWKGDDTMYLRKSKFL